MFQFPANPVIGQQFAPIVGVTYEWNGTGWMTLGPTPASVYPPGVIVTYAGAAPLPFQGWVLCDGASYLTANLPSLFAIIGYSYGGAGANFNVPDLRGRVIAGVDNMGGTAAGRLTPLAPLGGASGAESATLSVAQMPLHGHVANDPVHVHVINDGGHQHTYLETSNGPGIAVGSQGGGPSIISKDTAGTGVSFTGISMNPAQSGASVQNTGGGAAHANVQPTMVLNYIIKT
jgi:microcystin-dependent protein